MIDKITIYDNNGNVKSHDEIGAKGTNVSVSVAGLQSTNVEDALGELFGKVADGTDKMDDIYMPDTGELYVGEVVNGTINTSNGGTSSSDTELVSHSLMGYPQKGLTIAAHIASGYKVALYSGSDYKTTTLTDYVTNGGTLTINSQHQYYRVSIKKTDGSNISSSDIGSIGLHLTFPMEKKMWSIACTTEQSELVVMASRAGELPLIAHGSDTHSDNVRLKRMLDYCDKIGVLCCCLTGDYALETPAASAIYNVAEIINTAKSNVLLCNGNHDGSEYQINAQVRDNAREKLNYYGYSHSYRDFPAAKLRIISVDQYPTYNATTEDWLCNAVLGTPAGYGLLIMYHCPETKIYGELPDGRTTFFDVREEGGFDWYSGFGQMIQQIVDAFISGTVYNKVKTASATFDFSGKNTGATFVAHMSGHEHRDAIFDLRDAQWYVDDTTKVKPTNKQIMLNVTCASVFKGEGKNIQTFEQDAFNLYAIDLANKNINVVRIGGSRNSIKTMTISFAQP